MNGHPLEPFRTHVAKCSRELTYVRFPIYHLGKTKVSITILVVAKPEERNMFRSERPPSGQKPDI
jgi:hypothetical protein